MVQVRTDDSLIPSDLKWDMKAFLAFKPSYERSTDTLYLYKEKRPAVSIDVGGHFWVRFDPGTHEVVGIEVEDFERVFLARYPELLSGWKETKPRVIKKRKYQDEAVSEYLRQLFKWLNETIDSHPQQLGFAPT